MKSIQSRAIALVIAGIAIFGAAVWVGAGTTGIIAGVVKSDDGKPLSGVNIIIVGTKLTTVTDANGYYAITNVPPGDYDVRAEMVGYADASANRIQVTMDATATTNIEMKQEAIKETTAVVTRSRPMIAPDQINTLNLITSAQESLTRTDPISVNTVPGVLSAVPGVLVEPNGTGLMHIRGGRYDQAAYYIEGIPITDPNSGFFSDSGFTPGVSKFQAYTGGFGAEYGNAIAGVLNEVKKTGDANSGLHLTTYGGSDAYRSATTEIGGGTPDQFNYYVGSIMQENDMSGSPFFSRQNYYDSVAKLVWPSKNDTFTALALEGRLHVDVGGAGYVGGDFTTQRYTLGGLIWSHNFNSKSFITVRPHYIFTSTLQNMANNAPVPWVNDGSSRQTGIGISYTNQMNDRRLVKLGGSIIQGKNRQFTQNPLFVQVSSSEASVDTFQTALYAEQQTILAKLLTLNTGLRYEGITYKLDGLGDRNESSLLPRLGFSYSVDSRTAWKVNWGKYTKFVPSNTISAITTREETGEDEVTNTVTERVLGSSSPMQSTAAEFSFEKQVSDSVAYRITPYYADFKNLSDASYLDSGFPQYVNIGNGESRGVEFYLRKKMSDNWQGWMSYTYQTVKAGQAGTPMAYTSWDQRQTLAAVANYKKGKWGHTMRADFCSGMENQDSSGHANPRMILTYSLNLEMPKGTVVDALSLSIYNLLNNEQVTQYSGIGEVYSKNGQRNVSLGFSKAF